jgi:hypothetical protein
MAFPEPGQVALQFGAQTLLVDDPGVFALLQASPAWSLGSALALTQQFIPTSVQPGPQAMLRWSSDGGRTWSSESWAGIGRVGEYKARVRWRRLGRARDRVYELTISEPCKVVVLGASIQTTQGTS